MKKKLLQTLILPSLFFSIIQTSEPMNTQADEKYSSSESENEELASLSPIIPGKQRLKIISIKQDEPPNKGRKTPIHFCFSTLYALQTKPKSKPLSIKRKNPHSEEKEKEDAGYGSISPNNIIMPNSIIHENKRNRFDSL